MLCSVHLPPLCVQAGACALTPHVPHDRNWSEQRYFDACESVNPAIKKKGFIYNPVESVHHDRKRPPAMGGVEPRYTTTLNAMSNWLPALDEQLPDVNTICDAMGKPIDADADLSMYTTSASYLGATGGAKVRFH